MEMEHFGKTVVVLRSAAVAAFCAAMLMPAATDAAELYEGKRITLIVGFKPGGTADADGRLIAKHLPRHIPGNPGFVVQNVPGAGGLTAINSAYNVAKADGMSIYQMASGHYLQQLAGSSAVRFDVSKMPVLGAWTRTQYALVVRSDKGKTIQDLRNLKEPLRVATSGIGTGTYLITVAWQKALGLNFQLITGYESSEQNLALERGEVDARTNSAKSVVVERPDWIKNDLVRLVAVIGPERDPVAPDVPAVRELNPNPGPYFDTIAEGLGVARPYVLSPGTPAANLKVLRDAWKAMLADKEFIADVEARKWEFVPTSYDRLETFYRRVVTETPPEVITELKALFP